MQIDVIIPTFNRAHTLKTAIESVLKQTYTHFRLYVVDDGSTDETAECLKQYQHLPNIHLLSQENRGVSAARNLAAKNSSNEWISFLDSDDEWLPNKLEKQVDYLLKNPEVRFLHSEEIWVRNGVRVNPKIKHQKSNDNIFLRSLDFCLISPSTVIMKRDLFFQCEGFDENFIVCEDYDLWLKVLVRENIGFISDNVTVKNGGHHDQLSTKFVAMDYWRIKSLVNLYLSNGFLSHEQKDQIKSVLLKKSDLLLRGYLKHHQQNSYDEVTAMIASINFQP